MTSKLTLSIDTKVIKSAKRLSKLRGQSISKIVEEYLKKIGQPQNSSRTKSSILELRGIGGKASNDFNFKEEIADYLSEKYK
ncbi:MAG: hypothetical protein K2U26_07745 [Cyclobacteriaceae bacterium]|nr:hypothetical protein [Cyclobacteriaceae bacterium]